MKINNGNPLDLTGQDGETIGVTVETVQAKSSMLLDGAPFTKQDFVLSQDAADPSLLTVSGIFTDTDTGGGSFTVTLQGESGPAVTYRVAQFKTQGRRAVTFTIDVA